MSLSCVASMRRAAKGDAPAPSLMGGSNPAPARASNAANEPIGTTVPGGFPAMNDKHIDTNDRHIDSAYWALRVAYGAVPIVAGLDKFTNLLVDWKTYLSPFAARLLPVSPATFLHAVGVVEIAVGLLVLFAAPRVGAWLATVWLACIALQIVTSGQHLDVAVRDAVMALGAYTLARLEEARQQAAHSRPLETAHPPA